VDLARLFQPFVQVDLSTTKRFGGTGLGLAISKHLAELMGGAVGARSEVGKGSTFSFTVRAPAQASPVLVEKPALPTPTQRPPLRILLAEDNDVNRQIAVKMLERLGYHADLVENGLDALAALAKKPYDVVLMDVHMPEMDGLEATRQVRSWARPQPWIIAITASALPDDEVACFKAGVNDYLAKPVKVDALEKALCQAPPLRTR
jgi:CheY-like chemotaxis protein